jgi:uncharacterized protein
MATLYVASTEAYVGKSALCIALVRRMRQDGFRVGYMKPLSAAADPTADEAIDGDAAFVRQTLGLTEPMEQVAPVLLTQGVVERMLRGDAPYAQQAFDAYNAMARANDAVVIEGTARWSDGTLLGLSADQISDALQAPILLLLRYHSPLIVDTALAVQRFIGDRLLGIVFNQVEEAQLSFVRGKVVPFLEEKGIPVLAVLPQDAQLGCIDVGELADYLGGQVIGRVEERARLVETLMVGAMGSESALALFGRKANKAVVTGGDRSDLQLAALATSTNALILTGGVRPTQAVLDRADECGATLIVLGDDTATAIERAEAAMSRVRFHQPAKLARFTALLDEHLDVTRLYDGLGLGQA